jgi:hypothetical protein
MTDANPPNDIGHHIVMLGRIIGAIDDKHSATMDSLIAGQDAIIRRLERLEQILAERAVPPA